MYLPAEMMEIGEVSAAAKDKASHKNNRGRAKDLGGKIFCLLTGSILPSVDPYKKFVQSRVLKDSPSFTTAGSRLLVVHGIVQEYFSADSQND